MKKQEISTTSAPAAIGPYSQGIKAGDMVFVSGQLGFDPATGEIPAGVEAQTHQVMKNLTAILKEAGCTLDNIIKTTIFVKDLNDFVTVNGIYAQYLNKPYPARSTIEVARLPKDALVEIEAIAYLG